jgi:hypothetical protein
LRFICTVMADKRLWTRRDVRRDSGALTGYVNRRKASERSGENVPSRGRIQTRNSSASTPSATGSEGTEVNHE